MIIVLIEDSRAQTQDACQAKDLFLSHEFRAARQFAEVLGDRWFILSARYGLVEPDQEIKPYDDVLSERSYNAKYEWAVRVRDALKPHLASDTKIIAAISPIYLRALESLLDQTGCELETPLKELRSPQRRTAWLQHNAKKSTRRAKKTTPPAEHQPQPPAPDDPTAYFWNRVDGLQILHHIRGEVSPVSILESWKRDQVIDFTNLLVTNKHPHLRVKPWPHPMRMYQIRQGLNAIKLEMDRTIEAGVDYFIRQIAPYHIAYFEQPIAPEEVVAGWVRQKKEILTYTDMLVRGQLHDLKVSLICLPQQAFPEGLFDEYDTNFIQYQMLQLMQAGAFQWAMRNDREGMLLITGQAARTLRAMIESGLLNGPAPNENMDEGLISITNKGESLLNRLNTGLHALSWITPIKAQIMKILAAAETSYTSLIDQGCHPGSFNSLKTAGYIQETRPGTHHLTGYLGKPAWKEYAAQQQTYTYYYLNRPPGPGVQPKGMLESVAWSSAGPIPTRMPDYNQMALGLVTYAEPLSFSEVARYELEPDPDMPAMWLAYRFWTRSDKDNPAEMMIRHSWNESSDDDSLNRVVRAYKEAGGRLDDFWEFLYDRAVIKGPLGWLNRGEEVTYGEDLDNARIFPSAASGRRWLAEAALPDSYAYQILLFDGKTILRT